MSLYQSGTFAPDSNNRWMASLAQDKMGNVAMGYSIASSTMYDSISATGRALTDPLGQMQAEVPLIAGTGSQASPTAGAITPACPLTGRRLHLLVCAGVLHCAGGRRLGYQADGPEVQQLPLTGRKRRGSDQQGPSFLFAAEQFLAGVVQLCALFAAHLRIFQVKVFERIYHSVRDALSG